MLAFETHKFVKQLTGAGMTPEQAEVLAETYATILTEQVATKADIRTLRQEIAAVESSLKKDIAAVRKEMAAMDTSLLAEFTARMDIQDEKLVSMENRLERRIVTTGLINVVAVCTILGLLITVLT